ncbi:hypothetical protein ABZ725_10560 [Streptomyces sp. NPDC006872]|uniref:hypothetical protein n=1 Tax=Streptomyces sp. NPDC006872 TaxID=3155720 RepID=UPI0033C23DCA
MTAQAPDVVLFGGRRFWVTAVDGVGLFDPAEHGLGPGPMHTGCYRGYICEYAVVERRLVLRGLRLGSDAEPPPLGGVRPRREDEWHYRGTDVPTAFTGRLLIGSGTAADLPYLNMGFAPAWTYRKVHELTLRAGVLLTADDCSSELAAVRAAIADTAARPAPGEPTREWISRTFSLTYDYSWPGRS